MLNRLIATIWNRYRPAEGWGVFALLLVLVVVAALAVLGAAWVPEDGIVPLAMIAGLLLGMVLAKRPLSTLAAWIFLILYGLLINVVWLGRLWPPLSALRGGWWAMTAYWRIAWALFADRIASWFTALFSGGHSAETAVFALCLGLAAWLLAAFAAWSLYRLRQPALALTGLGVALAANGYFGNAPQWLSLFVGLATLLLAMAHFVYLEQGWVETAVDYSGEIRLELTFYAVGAAVTLAALAFVLPAFSIQKLADYWRQQPIAHEIDQTLNRVFSGAADSPGSNGTAGLPGGSGVLPRAYLLGNAPELTETVVMTAVVISATTNLPITAAEMAGQHWRGLSYEAYTERGWTISEERQEKIAAAQTIPLPAVSDQTQYRQTVYWQLDERKLRYTLGFPLQFDQPVTAYWSGRDDFVRVLGEGSPYTILTTRATADPDTLRETRVADIPPVILARYTVLPDTVPQRVSDLAQEVAGAFNNPYDQARALERFLRQYTYSLDVPLPPAEADVVDYFLFEAQQGYCDYYASAMVVMARSLGLPARMAVGFLAQEPVNGVQTVREINGHSWAEVYFAGVGWVEFEPTAGFALPPEGADLISNTDELVPDEPVPPPLPVADARPFFTWQRAFILLILAGVMGGLWWLQSRRPLKVTGVAGVYDRFQQQAIKLGAPPQSSQTPQEFAAHFLQGLRPLAQHPRLAKWVDAVQKPVRTLTAVFERSQYGKEQTGEDETAVAQKLWQRLRRPLRLLRIFRGMRD